jgi:hypothetical protein
MARRPITIALIHLGNPKFNLERSCGAEVNRNEILKGKISVPESARALLRETDESVKAPRANSEICLRAHGLLGSPEPSAVSHEGKNQNVCVAPAVLGAAQKDGEELLRDLRTALAALPQAESGERARTTGPNEVRTRAEATRMSAANSTALKASPGYQLAVLGANDGILPTSSLVNPVTRCKEESRQTIGRP